MVETPQNNRDGAEARNQGAGMGAPEAKLWFVREVLPLEAALMQFLRHNWRNESDLVDIRQDVYARVFAAAAQEIPRATKAFVFTTAKNVLINRVKHERIVPIEAASDLEIGAVPSEDPGPDRQLIARDELRRLHDAVERLPVRCREAFTLQQVQGLSRREIGVRMGVTEKTVKRHLEDAVRALADIIYGEPANVRKRP
jgi:RNA polymerase sigma-70 factor (ECF subfamily)